MSSLPKAASRMREFTALPAGRPVGRGRHGAGPDDSGSCAQLPPAQLTASLAPTGGLRWGSSRVYFLSQNPKCAPLRELGKKPGERLPPLNRIQKGKRPNQRTNRNAGDARTGTASFPSWLAFRHVSQWLLGQHRVGWASAHPATSLPLRLTQPLPTIT